MRYDIYRKDYLEDLARIVMETWHFEKDLKNPKDPMLINRYYIKSCLIGSVHQDVVVENGRALGVLFGSDERRGGLAKALAFAGLGVRFLGEILLGRLGRRRAALRMIREMSWMSRAGEAVKGFDSEVNLFILSGATRGKGYGRALMDRYLDFCRAQGMKKVFLWTTPTCTYSFYDRYGFQRIRTVERGGGEAVMIYAIEVK